MFNTSSHTLHCNKMNSSAKLLQLLTFGLLFVAFALASNANSTNPKNSNNISNTYCDNTADAETCDVVAKMMKLKAKREMSDAPTLLMYLAIAAIIVIPQIQQLDI